MLRRTGKFYGFYSRVKKTIDKTLTVFNLRNL